MVGMGWDGLATPTVSFTPTITLWGGLPGNARDRFYMVTPFGTYGEPDRNVAQFAAHVGIAMTFH